MFLICVSKAKLNAEFDKNTYFYQKSLLFAIFRRTDPLNLTCEVGLSVIVQSLRVGTLHSIRVPRNYLRVRFVRRVCGGVRGRIYTGGRRWLCGLTVC